MFSHEKMICIRSCADRIFKVFERTPELVHDEGISLSSSHANVVAELVKLTSNKRWRLTSFLDSEITSHPVSLQ